MIHMPKQIWIFAGILTALFLGAVGFLQVREATRERATALSAAAAATALAEAHSRTNSLLAALPLALGMAQTLGLMGLVGIDLNPANLIGIPLILGIAVDYGVHIVHDSLERPGPYRISASTANSVLVDALTTILGFGALMVASHKGLESLGRVLTIGVTTCTLTSLVFLPAVLALVRPGRAADDEADDAQDADDDADGDLTDDDAADAATVPFGKTRIRRAA
jgi:predicted exporter